MPGHYLTCLVSIFSFAVLLQLPGCTKNANDGPGEADAYTVVPSVSHADSILVVKEVRLMLDNYYRDIKVSGLRAEFKYLDSTASFFWVPPGYASALTYDSVVAILKQNAPMYSQIDNHFDTLNVIPLNTYTAVYTGRVRSVMVDTSGNVNTYLLLETGVVVKRQAGWKLLSGQTAILPN